MTLVGAAAEERLKPRIFYGLLPERFAFAVCLGLLALAGIFSQGPDEYLLLAFYLGSDATQVAYWKWISSLGSGALLLPIVSLTSMILFGKRQATAALGLLFGFGLTMLTVNWLKWLVSRERPPVPPLMDAEGLAFPSGHAAQAVYVCLFLAVLLRFSETAADGWAKTGLRRVCLGFIGVLPWAVGYSRVALGVHWPSDVLGGWAVGLFFSVMALVAGHNRFRCFKK